MDAQVAPAAELEAAALDASLPVVAMVALDAAPVSQTASDAGASNATLRVRFVAKLGSEPLHCGRTYPRQGRTQLDAKVQDFRFFVSSVRLLTPDGGELPVALEERAPFQTKELALLDFTDGTDSCTNGGAETNTALTLKAPVGRYVGIAFSTSVPEALNHADPASAPKPLQAPGVSWDWLQGYRFFLAELRSSRQEAALDAGSEDAGNGDAGNGNTATPGGGHHGATASGLVLVHVGSTGCVGSPALGISCSKPNRNQVRLTGFDPATNTIVADLSAVFAEVDLTQDVECHARGERCAPMFSALGIDLTTGQPLATQQVFRVE